jgi:hypothetical protein
MDNCIKEMERNRALAGEKGQSATEKEKKNGIRVLRCIKGRQVLGWPGSLCLNTLSIPFGTEKYVVLLGHNEACLF